MDNNENLTFADILRIEGINSKGFGILPKFVMLDTDLTIEAKTIYAYFCSFAGNGTTSFPGRDKILSDLSISNRRYYKHFGLLKQQGYISVTQKKDTTTNRFGQNIYTLIDNPKKFQQLYQDTPSNAVYNRILTNGLRSAGFGTIPKSVMIDTRLPLKSKGIYAYFVTFLGGANSAFPKLATILYHLNITKDTYYKFFKILTQLNYITAVQRHIDGKLMVNDYYLNNNPDEINVPTKKMVMVFLNNNTTKTQVPKNITTEIQVPKNVTTETQIPKNVTTEIQIPKNVTTEIQIPKNVTTEGTTLIKSINSQIPKNEYTENELPENELPENEFPKNDTNNKNSLNKNNLNKNQSINQSIDGLEGLSEAQKRTLYYMIKEELQNIKQIPYSYNNNPLMMEIAIHILTYWDDFYPNGFENPLEQATYNLCNAALIEMCCAKQLITIKNAHINYSMVIDKINELLLYSNTEELSIWMFITDVITDYMKAAEVTDIKNPMAYMKSCIWNAMQIGDIKLYSILRQDGYC